MPHFPLRAIIIFLQNYKFYKRVTCAPYHGQHFGVRLFISVSSSDVKQHFIVVLICFPLIINKVEHLFMLTICVSSSVKNLFITCLFFFWLVIFPYSFMGHSLCIKDAINNCISYLLLVTQLVTLAVSQDVVVRMLVKITIISRL